METGLSQAEFKGTDRYRIIGRLGQGGMGMVYHVFDNERREEVALKTLHRMSPQALLLFKQESRGLVDVVHPNLVSLYELSTAHGVWFITMELVRGCGFLEYVGGPSLRAETETQTGTPPGADSTEPSRIVPYVPAGNLPDLKKLRDCTIQLVRGVEALHATGRLHRDIKPSNVLVSGEGRLVLVDFGLVTEIAPEVGGPGSSAGLRGTVHYMAPELFGANRKAPSPATDWYSLGVMLYEALTGTLPFPNSWLTPGTVPPRPPPAPSAVVTGVPALLEGICMDLLDIDASKRPSGRELLTRLGEEPGLGREHLAIPLRAGAPFVGRAEQLTRLRDALLRTRSGRPVFLLVTGPSGVGKTTLVRHFLHHARDSDRALVLEGRCYDRESVPYKAIDSLVDRLSEHLAGLDAGALRTVLSPDFRFLADLFPVLQKVQQLAPTSVGLREPEDLPDRRLRAFGAFRHILGKLSVDQPLILFIDDLQWADLDSGALLAELFAPPEPPRFLVVACRRSGDARTWEQPPAFFEGANPESLAAVEVEHLPVAPLPPTDARELALNLLSRYGGSQGPELANAIASDSAGYPFFIHELALQASEGDADVGGARPTLGRVLEARIRRLLPDARNVLDAVVVAGRPARTSVVLGAARVISHDREVVAALRAAGFVIVWGSGDNARLEAAHDRIRQFVTERLSADSARVLHERLAHELERQGDPDLEGMFEHFLQAGIQERAGEYAVRAAEQADRALAFERAAELFQKAVDLLASGADPSDLLAKVAAALASAGHAVRAAEKYLEAASAVPPMADEGARPRKLRRLAAEQYLKNGDLSSGWRVMRQVLKDLRIPVPGSHWRAIVYSTWRRILFLVRGLSRKVVGRIEQQPARVREKLEVLWAVSTSFSLVNVILSDAFRGMHLLGALKVGDQSIACRALAYEVAMETYIGGKFFDRSCQRILERVEELAMGTGDPYDQAWRHIALACVSLTHGRFRQAVEACRKSAGIFREGCPGSHWEVSTVLVFERLALALLGDFRELRRAQEQFLAGAKGRKTLFGVVECQSGEPILPWVAADCPEQALEAASSLIAQQTIAKPTWPENGYRAQKYYQLVSIVYTQLYRGRPVIAWRTLLEHWSGLRGSFLESLRVFHSHLASLRGRVALALIGFPAADGSSPGGGAWTQQRMIRDLEVRIRVLRRDEFPAAAPWAASLEAGLACLAGDFLAARSALGAAIEGFEKVEMGAYREAARYSFSKLVPPGSERDRLREQAEAWLRDQGVLKIEPFVAALCPGIWAPA